MFESPEKQVKHSLGSVSLLWELRGGHGCFTLHAITCKHKVTECMHGPDRDDTKPNLACNRHVPHSRFHPDVHSKMLSEPMKVSIWSRPTNQPFQKSETYIQYTLFAYALSFFFFLKGSWVSYNVLFCFGSFSNTQTSVNECCHQLLVIKGQLYF